MYPMMFYFRSILQIWIVFIGFRDTNDFVNFSIVNVSSNLPAMAIADLP